MAIRAFLALVGWLDVAEQGSGVDHLSKARN